MPVSRVNPPAQTRRKGSSGAALVGAGALVGLGLGFLILAGLGLMGRLPDWFDGEQTTAVAPVMDHPAPDFTLPNLEGESLATADLRGKNLLINFWATWCGPCRQEMPMLAAVSAEYGEDLVVLAVNIGEEPSLVQRFIQDLGLSFTVLIDEANQVQNLYRVRAYPTTYLIDAEGVIRAQHVGLLSEAQLAKYLERVELP